jgi:hypothetical protein
MTRRWKHLPSAGICANASPSRGQGFGFGDLTGVLDAPSIILSAGLNLRPSPQSRRLECSNPLPPLIKGVADVSRQSWLRPLLEMI